MVRRALVVLLWPCVLAAGGEAKLNEQAFEGLLYRGAGGQVWYGQPVAPLGMFGVMAWPPEWRLSPALAKELAPLVNTNVGDIRGTGHHHFHLPGFLNASTPLERVPRVLVRFRGRYRLVGERAHKFELPPFEGVAAPVQKSAVYEIVGVDVWHAELLDRDWLLAWRRLDAALREMVAASLAPPGEAKRARLTAAVEKGSQALTVTSRVEVDDAFRATVRGVAPKARVVRHYQLGHQWGYREWAATFHKLVARLRIVPTTPLPPAPPAELPVLAWLAEGKAADAIVADVRATWGDGQLDRTVAWLASSRRLALIGDLPALGDAELGEARAWARKQIADKRAEAQRPKPKPPPRTRSIKELGIVAAALDDDLFAQKLILGGILVEQLLPNAPDVGLRQGDIVLHYRRIYDLVMGGFEARQALAQFARRAKHARTLELKVLRGEQLVALTVKPRG